jgi:hypothetical protein
MFVCIYVCVFCVCVSVFCVCVYVRVCALVNIKFQETQRNHRKPVSRKKKTRNHGKPFQLVPQLSELLLCGFVLKMRVYQKTPTRAKPNVKLLLRIKNYVKSETSCNCVKFKLITI